MKAYAKKVGKTLLLGLIILVVAGVVYLFCTNLTIGVIITLIIWGVYIMTLIYLCLDNGLKREEKENSKT